MNVSFKASLVNYSTIIKRDLNNRKEENVVSSFVELDPQNSADHQALREIAYTWDRGASLANDIYDNFTADRYRARAFFATGIKNIKFRYFALLNQYQLSEKELDSDSILGVASFIEEVDNTYTLQQIQTHPNHSHSATNREYRHIGEAMLKSILNLILNKDIKLFPVDENAKAFYKKFNFKQIPRSDYMRLKF